MNRQLRQRQQQQRRCAGRTVRQEGLQAFNVKTLLFFIENWKTSQRILLDTTAEIPEKTHLYFDRFQDRFLELRFFTFVCGSRWQFTNTNRGQRATTGAPRRHKRTPAYGNVRSDYQQFLQKTESSRGQYNEPLFIRSTTVLGGCKHALHATHSRMEKAEQSPSVHGCSLSE